MAILEIAYRNMSSSVSVEGLVRQRFAQLEKIHDRLTSCRVVIEKAPEEGKSFHVHVVMGVPGREIVVRRDRSDDPAHADALAAIRDAFDAARRQLEDHVRRMDNREKAHGPGAD
jgi:ribosome-associated translation inhibitor RaiA